MFKINSKLWLETNSDCVIGQGRAEMLHKIKELGSLKQVAKSMGMSYSHAWSEIKEISDAVGGSIIETSTGGMHGGGSCLTALGEEVLRLFDNEKKCLERYLARRNKKLSAQFID